MNNDIVQRALASTRNVREDNYREFTTEGNDGARPTKPVESSLEK